MAQEPEVHAALAPLEPETIEDTGLPESTIETLVLKILYFRGDLYGQDLSTAIGLKFSVIQDVVETFKLQHLIQVKRSLGMGNVGSVLALTEAGRARAREHLETNQYNGPAPVPLEQYAEWVRRQKPREGWLTKEALAKALRGMVVTERLLSQVGPAISSANSLLLYGKPGDGKTFLIESLADLDTAPIFLPYALESQGNIVQLFDPIYHKRIEEEEEQPSVLTVSTERSYDKRWARCKRPFIVSGGELTLDMLDLRYNAVSKVYEAPFQLKANNGIYLIDDFGRQRATPAEVLNRWIVPMERRLDYLSFVTGGKMTAPFEAFLVFSTNLNPADLGDEAFLRRIQYKLLLRSPAENEFIRIFESFCTTRRIPFTRDLIKWFIDKHYRQRRKPFRRCHPRDVLGHALNLIHFEKLPLNLTAELLDRAFESCFLQEGEEQTTAEAPILPVMVKSCADFWGDKVAQITTALGTLVFTASFRDRATGRYHEPQSARQYGEAETSRVLQRLHQRAFVDWLALSVTQQNRDLARFMSSPEGNSAKPIFEHRELLAYLPPAEARPEEIQLFSCDLGTLLEQVCAKPAAEIMVPAAYPAQIERIA
jgi:hypothetical protein